MSISGINSSQLSQLDAIANRAQERRANDGNLSPVEVEATMKEIESFLKNGGGASLPDSVVKAAKDYVKSKMNPVDTKISSMIENGFALGRVGTNAVNAQNAANKADDGFLGGMLRRATAGNPRIAGSARALGIDVNNNGDNRQEATANQRAADQARAAAVSRVMNVNDRDFQNATRTHCVGDALKEIGFANNLPPSVQMNTGTLKTATGKDWTGISTRGGITPAAREAIARHPGKVLVQEGNHTMVLDRIDKDGNVFAKGRKEPLRNANIFVPEKPGAVSNSARSSDRSAHTFNEFATRQSALDPHFSTESPDQKNIKKAMVLFTDKSPASRTALASIASAASKSPIDYNSIKVTLASKGIQISENQLKNLISTMTQKFEPPKELKNNRNIGGESLGKASNMFEALQLLSTAKTGTVNSILGGIENTNPKETIDRILLDGNPATKANNMFNQLQALANGEDGC
ncbi:MAG: hypothetical protein AABZ74_05350 [Cyanobacteriota bacterium]